jgi:hypothetical protein
MVKQGLRIQDEPSTDPADSSFFPWISLSDGFEADWAIGLAYATVGIVGALLLVYFAFDSPLPGIGGSARINALEAEREELERERQEVLERRRELLDNEAQVDKDRAEGLDAVTKSYDQQVEERVKEVTRARRSQTLVGIPLYVILGGVVASAFATSLLQALVIGFGWTGVVQAVGLRGRSDVVKEESAKELEGVKDTYKAQLDQQRRLDRAENDAKLEELSTAVLALSTAVAKSPSPDLSQKAPISNGESPEINSPVVSAVEVHPTDRELVTLDPLRLFVESLQRWWRSMEQTSAKERMDDEG